MNLVQVIAILNGKLARNISFADIAKALKVSRQYVHQIKEKELSKEQMQALEFYYQVSLNLSDIDDDCINIPVKGGVIASMGYGVTTYNEAQTATYSISKKLADDLGVNKHQTEIIFAQGDSMMPTIEGGDSLLVDLTRTEIYDGKIYCVRIEGQLYAKRLQKIPPNIVRVVSDNDKYRCFELELDKCSDYDFKVIGEVRWWGRVAR